jgi:hypothetical protein
MCISNDLEMITILARGNSANCVLLTYIHNIKTNAIALEHSLSPHYYMTGDFARVRKEAFLLALK